MKFMKLDTTPSAASSKPTTTESGYMYLDDMLDKTFMTDYFLH